jgi:transporter family-2 protein
MAIVYSALAFLAGVALPIQIGLNTTVARVSSPFWASAISFLLGTTTLFVVILVTRQPAPTMALLSSLPVWVWLAGVLGAFYVTVTIVAAPKIGAALLLTLVVAGQMSASLVVDHVGAFNFPVQPISPQRLLGACLIIAGVLLIRKF